MRTEILATAYLKAAENKSYLHGTSLRNAESIVASKTIKALNGLVWAMPNSDKNDELVEMFASAKYYPANLAIVEFTTTVEPTGYKQGALTWDVDVPITNAKIIKKIDNSEHFAELKKYYEKNAPEKMSDDRMQYAAQDFE